MNVNTINYRNTHVDNPKQSLTTLSLCTGYGGIERGLELAGEQLNVLAAVEIEAFAIANLVAKMEQGKLAPSPIWSNLKTLPVGAFRDRVDLITGGYPCQPFSAAGKRAGKDDPRHLWPYIRDIIESVRPVRCFFENVEGHISLGLREVVSDLESLGYKTAWGIFSATEVGAPHQRKRVYILADSSSAGLQGAKWLREAGAKGVSERHSAQCFGELGGWQGGRGATWSSQSSILRVVNGCANRVDRIRLLGNGVVPATAANAWQVLNEELAKNE
jgi:DNA (cytosine-5)-methyltransferase 1